MLFLNWKCDDYYYHQDQFYFSTNKLAFNNRESCDLIGQQLTIPFLADDR